MCATSYVGDYWRETLPQKPYYPFVQPFISPSTTGTDPNKRVEVVGIPMNEFYELKRDVEELKKLLTAAKNYDEAVGEPDCQMEDKVELIRKVAKLVGVEIEI